MIHLFAKINNKFLSSVDPLSSVDSNIDPSPVNENKTAKVFHEPFQLPIHYLDKNEVHPLSTIVANDLELSNSLTTNRSMYEVLFQPKHQFAKNMIVEWKKKYTTNIDFLKDTQEVLTSMPKYLDGKPDYPIDCEKIMEIWGVVKEDSDFLEKYSYMEWDILKHLNESSIFLQSLSIVNIMSPVMSLLIPIIMLIVPFIILKIQRTPITFSFYLDILKSIAKNHFIGKALLNMGSLSFDKVAYLMVTFAFYLLQIYQHIVACMRFYNNIHVMNDYLYHIRNYLKYSIHNMDTFVNMHQDKPTYTEFCKTTTLHCSYLKEFYSELQPIGPFVHDLSKLSQIGYMLKCFYHLHVNPDYENGLRYSAGFEGYIDNLEGVYKNIESKAVAYTKFDRKEQTNIQDQYYPPLVNENPVKNSCKFNKSIIITAPNAAGKTTFIKTTTINIIFSQQFGCGFYKKCVLNPYTHIHSYLNIPDTSERDSLFQAESRRCKEIIDVIHNTGEDSRHFCIFDELYSGTNPTEATKAAYGFLKYLSEIENVDFILTTHYVSICNKFKKSDRIANYKMDVENLEGGKVRYTYKLKKGISKIQGAVKILKDMDYPAEILENIENFSRIK
jgi:hypothetical protein